MWTAPLSRRKGESLAVKRPVGEITPERQMAAMLPGVGVKKSRMFPEWPIGDKPIRGLDRFVCGHVKVGEWDEHGPTYTLIYTCSDCRFGRRHE